MNTTPLTGRPEVTAFVAAVRAHFADLDAEEREELLGGLEADMSDLVTERGPDALGEPTAYAAELRAAAGLPAAPPLLGGRPAAGERVEAWLDGARRRLDAVVIGLPGDPWGFVQALRPAWWLLRAYVAVQMVDLLFGNGSYDLGLDVLPSLREYGAVSLAVVVLVSVQVGRGRLWPGRGGAAARLLLLLLNLVAVTMTPYVATSLISHESAIANADWYANRAPAGDPDVITYQGRQVCTLRVLDKQGNRVEGLRVWDAASDLPLPMNNPAC